MSATDAEDREIVALVDEFDSSYEEARGPIARALDDRGGAEAAPRLARADDAAVRRAAARLMSLLPDDRHVAALLPLVVDPEPRVADAAWRALRGQRRTDEWRAAVEQVAEHGPPERREDARRWLSES